MKTLNEMKMIIDSRSVNEAFSRVSVASFVSQLDPTVEEISDLKTAVSEAVTNCIVHAYPEGLGKIYISATLFDNGTVRVKIRDKGVGIPDIEKAMEPLYSSLGGERAGLGFAVMESFTDKVRVSSKEGSGTTVTLTKKILGRADKK